ncbi:hypothetical protein Gotur_026685, partial [Gossypium turneri]
MPHARLRQWSRVRGVTFYWYQSRFSQLSKIRSMNKSLPIHAVLIYFDSVTTPDDFKMCSFIVMDPERAGTDEVESNAPVLAEGTTPPDVNVRERPASVRQGGGAKEALFQAMNDWFVEFVRTNLAVRPPPPQDSQVPHVASLAVGIVIRERPPVDKIRKQGAEEFR